MFRKKPKKVDLSNAGYMRYLRAQGKPELGWFLGLSELEQETLARIGDEYLLYIQEMASEGPAPSGMSDEEAVRAATREAIDQVMARAQPPEEGESFAGIGKKLHKRKQFLGMDVAEEDSNGSVADSPSDQA